MKFYNVRKHASVEIPETSIKKRSYEGRGGTVRYAVRAVDDDTTQLTAFVSKETYDRLDVPVEE